MRKNRILKKGAIYHVVANINRNENIFEPNEFKSLFLEVIKRSKEKYDFNLRNFSIMHNHIHFLIEPLKKSNLSSIMQWILSVFAIYYNAINELKGHVWRNRFWSRIIDDIRQLIDTFNYVSENPVKAYIAKNANEYKFGGRFFIEKKIFDIVTKPDFKYF